MKSRLLIQDCRQAALSLLVCTLLVGLSAGALAAERFVVTDGNAEMLDRSTGLVWQRCAEGQGWNGITCVGSPLFLKWQQALQQAQVTAASTGKAWRLPNFKELMSLEDRTRMAPALDTTAFPGAPANIFWSSTPYADASSHAWGIFFHTGAADAYYRSDSNAVRLVRSLP